MWKQILGAIVGALIGIVLMVVLERAIGKEFGWTVIPIGILTGIGVSLAADKPSFVRGAFAAFLTLAAFAGGKLCASYLGQQAASGTLQPVAVEEEAAGPDVEATTESEGGDAEERSRVDRSRSLDPRASQQGFPPVAAPASGSTLDVVWLVVGAAIAYVLGRGSAKPEAPEEGQSASEAPAAGQPDAINQETQNKAASPPESEQS